MPNRTAHQNKGVLKKGKDCGCGKGVHCLYCGADWSLLRCNWQRSIWIPIMLRFLWNVVVWWFLLQRFNLFCFFWSFTCVWGRSCCYRYDGYDQHV